jgi:hypothetical protein
MNAYQRYKQTKNTPGWAIVIANEFGWAWSNLLVQYDQWLDGEIEKLNQKRKQNLIKDEREFIDEFLTKGKNTEWARKRRIAYLEKTNPTSTELKMLKDKKIIRRITDEMVESAKEFPINQLLGEAQGGKYNCLWHDDTNPSMHYYKKTNSVYCFSCGTSGDAIDIYRRLYNTDFKTAVKNLS